jgi:O-antigen/teichoic acid export membrane protein
VLKDALARLSRHTIVYAAAGQLSKVASLVLLGFFTLHLDPAEYGTSDLLGYTIQVLGYVAGINMTAAMARHYFDSADPRHRRRVVSTTLWTVLGASLLVGGLVALGAAPIGAWLSEAPARREAMTTLVLITLGILVLQLVREVFWRYLQTENRSTAFALSAVAKTIVEVSLQIWFVGYQGRGLLGMFEAVLLSEALAVLALALALLPTIGLSFDRALFRQLAAYTLPLVPNGLLQFCLHNGDRFVLKTLRGEAEVGLYGFAYKLGQIPHFLLLTPFLMVWYPFIFSVGDEARQRELVGRISAYFLAAATALALGVSILAPELVRANAGKPEYLATWQGLPWICAGYWFWAAFQMAQTGFYVRKRTSLLPWLTGIAAVFNLGLNWLLLPRYGWVAAAWVTTATFVLLLLLSLRAVRPIFAVDFPWARIFSPLLAAGLVLGAGLWLVPAELAPLPAGLRLLGGLPAGTIAIKLGLCLLWLAWMGIGWMTAEERAAARGVLAGLRRRPAAD